MAKGFYLHHPLNHLCHQTYWQVFYIGHTVNPKKAKVPKDGSFLMIPFKSIMNKCNQ